MLNITNGNEFLKMIENEYQAAALDVIKNMSYRACRLDEANGSAAGSSVLADPCGGIDALVNETYLEIMQRDFAESAEKVNARRAAKGLPELADAAMIRYQLFLSCQTALKRVYRADIQPIHAHGDLYDPEFANVADLRDNYAGILSADVVDHFRRCMVMDQTDGIIFDAYFIGGESMRTAAARALVSHTTAERRIARMIERARA